MMVHVTRTIDSDAKTAKRAASDPTGEVKDRIIGDFRSAMAELRCIGSDRLLRLGVSMSQLHVMSMLERHGEMSMSRLAEVIDVSVSNATGLIDRMEERGYVERTRVPDDRRIVLVRVAERGHALLEEIEILRGEMLRHVLDRLDEAQLAGLARATNDLHEALAAIVATPGALDHDHTADRWRA